MRVGRQRMINLFENYKNVGTILLVVALTALSACNPTEISSSGIRNGISYNDGTITNKAFIYRDSPAILDNPGTSADVNIRRSVDFMNPEFITGNSLLKGDCTFKEGLFMNPGVETGCVHSYGSKTATQQLLPRGPSGSWVYDSGTSEFYQVNNLYHVSKGIDTFFEKLNDSYDRLHNQLVITKPKSIPRYLTESKLFWFKAVSPSNDNYFRNSFLSSYALCNLELNARFSPAGPELCFGKWSAHPTFFMIQDPSIIYHELGHALISVMMNLRNGTSTSNYHEYRSNLGALGFSEAGSIGEGVADYWSYVMNKRTHIGEWGLTRANDSSRPMSESDPMHIAGIEKTSEGRLSYPQYLLYDPNEPDKPFEGVHNAGQIVSHYLVSLTESFKSKCSLPTATAHEDATSYVTLLLAETFSELGDLRSRGWDDDNGAAFPDTWDYRFNNLDEESSFVWSHVVNPPTFRRFFQAFAKNINKYISPSSDGLCSAFSKNDSEKLLDDYGLLLFKTYNDNMNSTKDKDIFFKSDSSVCDPAFFCSATPPPPTKVTETNRRKSVLVSKELIRLAELNVEPDIVTYYIVDDKENMQGLLDNMLFKGFPTNLSNGTAGVEYNNDNVQISPGEVVAIIPNLFNSSNSPMAGVQLLANDWDHVHITDTQGTTGNYKPCAVDEVTTVDQGAVANDTLTCAKTLDTFRRNVRHTVSTNPLVTSYCKEGGLTPFCEEAVAPVCMVELEESGSTRWVSQNEFRKKNGLALQEKDCLGYGYTGAVDDFTFNPHECLVRVLPGASSAFYSKIDPQKSYVSTMRNGNPNYKFSPSNAIVLEINKWIQPGTKFRCRLRARFSNCSDCFSDKDDATLDDYIDADLNGHKPFKVINFEFEVND